MSAPLPVGDVEKLRDRLANTTLADTELPARLCELPLAGDKSLPLLPGAKLVLEGRAAVYLLNAPEDVDSDGIVRARDTEADAAEDQAPPLLSPSAGQAWLKYTTAARLRSSARVEALGFAFDLQAPVALADYRLHPADAPLPETVIGELRSPARFAFSLDDVRALRRGEALSLRAGGAVELSLEVSASDALAAGVGAIAHLLEAAGSQAPLGIRVEAGARLRARVQVEDHFLLAFARDATGHRIVLRKAPLRQRSLVPSLAPRVLLDPLDVSALADTVLAALPRPPAPELLPHVRPRLEERIEQVAVAYLTAGFGFEYARLNEQEDLLAVRASEDWLVRHHADLVRGRLQPVLDGIRLGAEGVTLERFLDRRTLRTQRSRGLSLGLGGWVVAGKDRRPMSRVIRKLFDGRQARAYTGLSEHDGQLGDRPVAWTASVRADTQGFAAAAVPRVSEYRFGLALTWTCAEQRLGEDELRLLLDAAVLWNAVSDGDAPRLADQLRPLLGQPVEAVVQLVLDDEVLRRIMRRAATAPLSATDEACRRFHHGLGVLGRAIEAGDPDDEVVARGLADLGQLFTQPQHVRAAGVYLLDGARATGLARHPRRSLTVLSPGERDLVLGT